jgi:hypothetical protein
MSWFIINGLCTGRSAPEIGALLKLKAGPDQVQGVTMIGIGKEGQGQRQDRTRTVTKQDKVRDKIGK